MRDCASVYQSGLKQPGAYSIDPSGQGKITLAVAVYCENGWTHILRRGQEGNAKVLK